MKNIYIVRHGESEGNARLVGESTGYVIDSKINLTTKGILQASYAGIMLSEILKRSNGVVWVSPFNRTRQTARYIIEELERRGIQYDRFEDPRLVEQDFDDFDFQFYDKWEEISPHSRYINRARYDEPEGRFFARLENGENMLDVYNRMSLFVKTRLETSKYKENIIVTHGNASRALIMFLLNQSIEDYYYSQVPENASIRHIIFKRGKYIDKGYIE